MEWFLVGTILFLIGRRSWVLRSCITKCVPDGDFLDLTVSAPIVSKIELDRYWQRDGRPDSNCQISKSESPFCTTQAMASANSPLGPPMTNCVTFAACESPLLCCRPGVDPTGRADSGLRGQGDIESSSSPISIGNHRDFAGKALPWLKLQNECTRCITMTCPCWLEASRTTWM
jgi:hypothetical protein